MQTKTVVDVLPGDSFFREYMGLWEHTEPPRSFILFSAMAALGSCLGRTVWFDHDPHKLYPMVNLLLVGPSGTGKSTSVWMGIQTLINTLPPGCKPQIIHGAATQEKLHDDIALRPQTIIVASELANFFTRQKYMEGMVPYITELFDYPDSVERRTKSGSLVEVKEPAVTLVGGSTVDWLQEQLPSTATSGGFLARFLVVKEDHKYQRVANPKREKGTPGQQLELEARKQKAITHFLDLLRVHAGEIDFEDYEAADEYGMWYQTHVPETGHLAPFSARGGEFVLRLAVLLAISAHSNAIRTSDVAAAITLYEYSIRKLQEVAVPFSASGKLLTKVLEAVGTTEVPIGTLRRAMRNYCTSQEVDRLAESLVQSGDIEWTPQQRLRRVWR